MPALPVVLIIISAILLIALIITAVNNIKLKNDVLGLSDRIEKFIDSGENTGFSVRDNDFARLQNSISDLENMIEIEKSNTLSQTKKNTRFISDVSHQLKTPLSGLRLYCEMENEASPTQHTQKELLLIEKMEKLIAQLLKLEKIKSDTYTMDFQPHSLKRIVNQTLGEFYHLFPNKKYTVSGDSRLRCDAAWLSEAIGNVIKNAGEHTAPDGEIKITIEDASKSTVVTINDNGGGIDEEKLQNLFTRFYRTENSLPTSAGVGLAITKAIVEKHHGIITAENKNGGLCVIICLPHIDGYITI